MFVLVQTYWQVATTQVAKGGNVLAKSMLSLNTIGEAIDIIFLLRTNLLTVKRNRGRLIQSVLIILLKVISLFAGFIARYFTEAGVTELLMWTSSAAELKISARSLTYHLGLIRMHTIFLLLLRHTHSSLPSQYG